jgi:hypothetical protein
MLSTKAKMISINFIKNINDYNEEIESKLPYITEKLWIDILEKSISSSNINLVFKIFQNIKSIDIFRSDFTDLRLMNVMQLPKL